MKFLCHPETNSGVTVQGTDPGGCAVCGRSLVGIAASNPAGNMDVFSCEFYVLYKYRSRWRADPSSRESYRVWSGTTIILYTYNEWVGEVRLRKSIINPISILFLDMSIRRNINLDCTQFHRHTGQNRIRPTSCFEHSHKIPAEVIK